MSKFPDETTLLIQALRNVGSTFGGPSKTLCHAIAKEIERLKRWEETDRQRKATQRFNDAQKEYKATGKWPEGYGSSDDDIPF